MNKRPRGTAHRQYYQADDRPGGAGVRPRPGGDRHSGGGLHPGRGFLPLSAPREEISLKGLLYRVMLRSGTTQRWQWRSTAGGSVEEFVGRMNEKAAQLGMVNSHFANPNGLNAEGHYSSAYDMALLARACLENEALAEIRHQERHCGRPGAD